MALSTGAVADSPLYRLTVEPTAGIGRKAVWQVMAEEVLAYPRLT